jgi:hypothetical protein
MDSKRTDRRSSAASVAFCLLVAVTFVVPLTTAGCGTNVVPPTYPPSNSFLGLLRADLLGTSELVVVDPDAKGVALFEVFADGTLRYSITGEPGWTPGANGLRLHRGTSLQNGPVEIDLMAGSTFNAVTHTLSGQQTISPLLATEIAGASSQFYVNATTIVAPEGHVRGQIGRYSVQEWHALLLGTLQTTVVDANARGAASFDFLSSSEVRFVIAMKQPSIGTLTQAHIHAGAPGTDGPVVVDLMAAPDLTVNTFQNTMTGTCTLSLAQISQLALDTANIYCNVHTTAAPAGVARGQIRTGPTYLTAALRGDEASPVISPSARGGCSLFLNTLTQGAVHLSVPPIIGIQNVIGAHIHEGGKGVNGSPLVDLTAGADYVTGTTSFSSEGSIAYDQTLFTRLIANPGAFYVDIHTAAGLGAFARGQLSDESRIFFAVLAGNNEVPIVDPAAGGSISIVADSPVSCRFNCNMTRPMVPELVGLHVHDGVAGVNGPILINLHGGTNVVMQDPFISGNAVVSGRTVARLIAAADRFYVNAHSILFPAGVCRGQLSFRTDDAPPSGLSYSDPDIDYFTSVQITPNVPTVGGGAVAGYTISPGLPKGLTLDSLTGIITGIPEEERVSTIYTVTASNSKGDATALIDITVLESPPTNLRYTSPVQYVNNVKITDNHPANDGGEIKQYVAKTPLPTGLSVDFNTGVISGTPNGVFAKATYTITGSNGAGSTDGTVEIEVTATPQPPDISYPLTSMNCPTGYPLGQDIDASTPNPTNTPSVTGNVTEWLISPNLPTGMTFIGGVIAGKPHADAITSATSYTVTAKNNAGQDTFNVTIATPLGKPKIVTYTYPNPILYVGTAAQTNSPTMLGGKVDTWNINPALPAGKGGGLQFEFTPGDTGGQITGTPQTAGTSTHTITATNASGAGTFSMTIIVY